MNDTSRTEVTRTVRPAGDVHSALRLSVPGPEIQHPLVCPKHPVTHVERLVIHQQPDHLAVGDIDHRLPRLRQAVRASAEGKGRSSYTPFRYEPGSPCGSPFVQVPPPADVTVRQREHRLTLGEHLQVQAGLAQAPRLNRKPRMLDH